MKTTAATVPAVAVPALLDQHRLAHRGLDHDAWTQHLRDRLTADWRAAEFDPQRWLFTGDPTNPMTTSTTCRAHRCDTVVTSRTFCGSCRRRRVASGLDAETFAATHRRAPTNPQRTGEPPSQLQIHQFTLEALAPTVRWELLYALQQRDRQGQKLDPSAVKALVTRCPDSRRWP